MSEPKSVGRSPTTGQTVRRLVASAEAAMAIAGRRADTDAYGSASTDGERRSDKKKAVGTRTVEQALYVLGVRWSGLV